MYAYLFFHACYTLLLSHPQLRRRNNACHGEQMMNETAPCTVFCCLLLLLGSYTRIFPSTFGLCIYDNWLIYYVVLGQYSFKFLQTCDNRCLGSLRQFDGEESIKSHELIQKHHCVILCSFSRFVSGMGGHVFWHI